MRSGREELRVRRFQLEEVLTGQQINGFFSRLAAKNKKAGSLYSESWELGRRGPSTRKPSSAGVHGPFGNLCACDDRGFPLAPNCIIISASSYELAGRNRCRCGHTAYSSPLGSCWVVFELNWAWISPISRTDEKIRTSVVCRSLWTNAALPSRL